MAVALPTRLLVVPGLHDSGPAHWQSWLQRQSHDALRVEQNDWGDPDLVRWAARIRATLASQPPARWIAVAHSFGCLALARAVVFVDAPPDPDRTIGAALLVAPADPRKFAAQPLLPHRRLPLDGTLIGSETDPWMSGSEVRRWAGIWGIWGSRFISLGDAGHINAEAGFGPLPQARSIVAAMARRLAGPPHVDDRSAPAAAGHAVHCPLLQTEST